MSLTIKELAEAIQATPKGIELDRPIYSAAPLAEADSGDVAPLTDAHFSEFLATTKATAVILKDGEHPPAPENTVLLSCKDPEMAFIKALNILYPEEPEAPGYHPSAVVEDGAEIGEDVYLGPNVIVRAGAKVGAHSRIMGGSFLGRNCLLGTACNIFPNVVIYDNVQMGHHVSVHSGCVLGADGFGYKFRDGHHVKVPQVGGLIIEDHVELGANTCVDRGALEPTIVGMGSKLDNLVQIGHNVKLGQHVIICAHTGFAGSSQAGAYAQIGAFVGVHNRVKIGMGSQIAAKSGALKDIPPGGKEFGVPAQDRRAEWQQVAALRRLPKLLKTVKAMEKRIQELEAGLD